VIPRVCRPHRVTQDGTLAQTTPCSYDRRVRITARTTAISWIPSEAMTGLMRVPLDMGIGHYDEAPPDRLEGVDHLQALRDADRFRFANHLDAWIEVVDGTVTGWGQGGGAVLGSTTLRLGRAVSVAAVPLPDIRPTPEVGEGWVRFTQTGGGRTGVPMPRRVDHAPFVRIWAPVAWSTLELTIRVDGTTEHHLAGASPFPRHWVYGPDGALSSKSAITDFKRWYRHASGVHTPWGAEDSPALAVAVESALERKLSAVAMRDPRTVVRSVPPGSTLTEQGAPGDELYLVLDGVLEVIVDGVTVAEIGPGSIVGERAGLEGGVRTSTVRSRTRCRIAVTRSEVLERVDLDELSTGHRREERAGPPATCE
jgi:hypothetical protein